MKSRVPASLLALILMLTAAPVIPAQTNNSGQTPPNTTVQDWQGLRDLKSGKKILVEFKSGNTLDGKLVSIAGSTLTLSGGGNVYSLEQRDIQRVYRLKGRWSRAKAARIGAVILGGVGLLIGTDKDVRSSSPEPGAAAYAGLFGGALAGAGLGAMLGGKRKSKLLYEAK